MRYILILIICSMASFVSLADDKKDKSIPLNFEDVKCETDLISDIEICYVQAYIKTHGIHIQWSNDVSKYAIEIYGPFGMDIIKVGYRVDKNLGSYHDCINEEKSDCTIYAGKTALDEIRNIIVGKRLFLDLSIQGKNNISGYYDLKELSKILQINIKK